MNFKHTFKKLQQALLILCSTLVVTNTAKAQGPQPTGTSCADAIPFCTGTTYNFPNISGGAGAPPGLGYACLSTQPNAVWYYMKIANPGTLQINLNQYNTATGAGSDVDFAFWGPFTSLADGCTAINGGQMAIQSSYAGGATQEIISLGLPGGTGLGPGCATTPPPAQTGEFYILLMTNFSNQPGNIVFSQVAGTATTDCSIISCGVHLTSNSPICQGDSIRISMVNDNEPEYIYNYVWTGPNGYTSTEKEPAIGGLLAGTHTFSVDAITQLPNGDYDTCSQEIEVVVNLTYNTPIIENICSGDSILWYDNYYSVAGTYDTLLKTVTGCDSLLTLTLNVTPRPSQILMLDSIIACQYDSVALESNTLPYNDNYTYNWNPSINLNNFTDPNVWFYADQSRRYVLTVTNTVNGFPCSLRDTIDVIVNPGDFLQVPIKDTGICPGDTVQLTASGAAHYKWTPGTYLSNDSIANPIARTEITTTYELIGTSDKGCRDTQLVHITVHPAAVLELPESINLYPGEAYAMQPATNALHFNWFPNSGLNSNIISNPIMSPLVDTRYFVTARTEHGCQIQDSFDVWVKETVLDMPNAFNPNNSEFKVSMRGLATLETFEIYNRWGQKIFETKNIDHGWNGFFNGSAQPMGVYVYMVHATTVEGKPFKKTGNVTLVR